MNIEMALKSRSYILDVDHVKLFLGIFFLLGCFMESLLHQLSGYTFIFVKNTHQKAANLTFLLILPAAMVSWWFLGVQYRTFIKYRHGWQNIAPQHCATDIITYRLIRPWGQISENFKILNQFLIVDTRFFYF